MPHWLIVSGSARALAQSCVTAGHSCDVIDPFADTDTEALARRMIRADFDGGGFGDDLPARIAALDGRWDGIIAGSGFERSPERLAALDAFAPLVGNDAGTVRRCKTPDALANGLQQSGVPFAAVRTDGPAPAGWLMKRTGDCGGAHVRPAQSSETIRPGWHAQNFIAGVPASVLFLADGRRGRVIGLSLQRPGSAAGPYAWCEAVSDLPLGGAGAAALERDVDAVVHEFGLRGLNGADLVIGRDGHVVVELNPRPAATLALYDDRVPGGLFAAHVAASAGRLDSVQIGPASGVRGLRVVYAPHDLTIDERIAWPPGCTDLPATGSRIPEATPVCTVHAAGTNAREVHRLLQRLEHEVLHLTGLRAGQATTSRNNDRIFLRRTA